MKNARYLTAREAAGELNISVDSLYAYVSRGLIRSEATGHNRRSRRYYAEDVGKLKARKRGRRDAETVAEDALHAGAPVLESAITLITDDCVYYRGRSALVLARQRSIEQVAALIWTGNPETKIPALVSPDASPISASIHATVRQLPEIRPLEAFQMLLPLAAREDLSAYDLRTESAVRTGSRILCLLSTLAAGKEATGTGIASMLGDAWAPDDDHAEFLINAALILCADHELNASAFTARCAASTCATLYAVVTAALSAFQGHRHGGASEQVEALFLEMESRRDLRQAMRDRLKRGETLPGFGHVIYREVDPRGKLLLRMLQETHGEHPDVRLAAAIIQAAADVTSLPYNVDLALATLARVLNLPPGGAMTLFAMGRTVGWIGHAIEQYRIGRIIRPRARYVGELPEETTSIG